MRLHSQVLVLLSWLLGLGNLPLGQGLPSPQMGDYGENAGPVGGVTPPTPEVKEASGRLRGGPELLGGTAPLPDTSKASAEVEHVQLVPGQEADSKLGLFLDFNSANPPQPLRGGLGATDPGPRTYAYDKLNSDLFAPPGTDAGGVPNAKWPMGLSHNRAGSQPGSGWARNQNVGQLPIAKAMAGVDMRLAPHAYRELHWHTAGEWALMLKGCVRVSAVNTDGKNFIDDVCEGDVWFFPKGIPHGIQALEKGAEFLLVFDEGTFTEDGTFLMSEMMLRNPKSVLSKNFQADLSAFDKIAKDQLWIFNGSPAPKDPKDQAVDSPAGQVKGNESYTYHWSQQEPYSVPGGSVKIIDPLTFPVASGFSAALAVVQPGAMRELHWHTTSDEWSFFLQGSGRATVFAAPSSSRTYDFTAGDVGYIPAADGHYIENTGTEDLIFLEVLQAPVFSDISVNQWLALTPKQMIKDHTNLPDDVIDNLPKDKKLIIPGDTNMTALAGGGKSSDKDSK